jgi:hypothetical protein
MVDILGVSAGGAVTRNATLSAMDAQICSYFNFISGGLETRRNEGEARSPFFKFY